MNVNVAKHFASRSNECGLIFKLNNAGQAMHDGNLKAADVSWISKWDEKEYAALPTKFNRFEVDRDTSYPHIFYSTSNYQSQPSIIFEEIMKTIEYKSNEWMDKLLPNINEFSIAMALPTTCHKIGVMFDKFMQELMANIGDQDQLFQM